MSKDRQNVGFLNQPGVEVNSHVWPSRDTFQDSGTGEKSFLFRTNLPPPRKCVRFH